MQMDFTPTLRKGQLLRRREVLIADANHQIVQQSGADFHQHVVGHVLRQIDAGDVGAGGSSKFLHGQMAVLGIRRRVHSVEFSLR